MKINLWKKYQVVFFSFLLIIGIYIIYTESMQIYTENMQTNNLIVCFYAYYEKNEDYKNNLIYFLENGILDHVDYYIIINGNSSVTIPEKENIKVLYRENIGFDFGAYSYGIKQLSKPYDYYFFINTSVCGPYGDYLKKDWTIPFINLFHKDVKVVGTSINMCSDGGYEGIYKKPPPYSHVQSMFFCIDNEYFNYLTNQHFFNEEEMNKADMAYTITYKELGLSLHALNNGWNINCILSKYKDLDYRTLKNDINPTSMSGDPYYSGAYFGGNIQKEEVIFFKNNRSF